MWDDICKRVFGGLWAIGLLGMAGQALAEEEAPTNPIVVELFTAHDCPYCPPANAYLKTLSTRGDVIALSFIVDYWDKPEFKDLPNHEQRQRTYGWMIGKNSVYTPEMVIGGARHAAGYRRLKVAGKIRDEQKAQSGNNLAINASQTPQFLKFHLPASTTYTKPHDIVLIPYKSEMTVSVSPGTRDDRTYTNVAFRPRSFGLWHGEERAITIGISEDTKDTITGFTILLQEQGQGVIHAAKMVPIDGRS